MTPKPPKRLFARLTPAFFAVAVVAVIATSLFSLREIRRFYLNQLSNELNGQALLGIDLLTAHLDETDQALQTLCGDIGKQLSARTTIIAPDGRVRCDSNADTRILDNHLDRPEISDAIRNGSGQSIRYSDSVHKNLMYVAMTRPKFKDHILRLAVPLDEIDQTIAAVQTKLLAGGMLALLFAGALGFWISRKIAAPLEALRESADRIAGGHWNEKLPESNIAEIDVLAHTLARMVSALDQQIKEATDRRTELETVFNCMVEGILVIDPREQIFNINPAAQRLFSTSSVQALGRAFQEIIRDPDLQVFVRTVLKSGEIQQEEFRVPHPDGEDRIIHAFGTTLEATDSDLLGAVLVFDDITEMRRLESVRRDFVANVSHELKTPITSIKGYTETLLDGALEDRDNAERFLSIISRQSDRLTAIIEDLLSLAKVERLEEGESIDFSNDPLLPTLLAAAQNCERGATIKQINIQVNCASELSLQQNSTLLEQALTNLLDNAVKYSPEKSSVRIDANVTTSGIEILVQDSGPGIPAEHLPRLFERFYRVEPSRSRDMGGTGLGLAIVKHIMQAHGGQIDVESTIGAGSTFRLLFPATESPTAVPDPVAPSPDQAST